MKPTLYLPIEIKVREFPAKTLLALTAAKFGFRVYLGAKGVVDKLISEKEEKGGIYLYKGGRRLEDIVRIKTKVDCFVVLDEEMGPAVRDIDWAYKGRIYPNTESLIDKMFLVSKEHEDAIYRVRPDLASKAVVTGWPRVDLWKLQFKEIYAVEVAKIKRAHGDFLLFSSDFGIISSEAISLELESMRGGGYSDIDIQSSKTSMMKIYSEFIGFLDLIRKIDEDPIFPRLIIRPHPSEDVKIWLNLIRGMKKVEVLYQGEIGPWLYASRGLLHRGCTTAVQAYMAGVPTIYILGAHSVQNKTMLPYRVSWIARDYDELLSLSSASFKGDLAIKPEVDISNQIHVEETLSSNIIVNELKLFNLHKEKKYNTHPMFRGLWYFMAYLRDLRILCENFIKGKSKDKSIVKMKGGIHKNEVLKLSGLLMPDHEFSIIEKKYNLIEIDDYK